MSKPQALIDAEREYKEADNKAQAAIVAQNNAAQKLYRMRMEHEYGICIGDTLEWTEDAHTYYSAGDSWAQYPKKAPAKNVRGIVVDNEFAYPVVKLYKKDGTLGEARKTLTRLEGVRITHAEAPHA